MDHYGEVGSGNEVWDEALIVAMGLPKSVKFTNCDVPLDEPSAFHTGGGMETEASKYRVVTLPGIPAWQAFCIACAWPCNSPTVELLRPYVVQMGLPPICTALLVPSKR